MRKVKKEEEKKVIGGVTPPGFNFKLPWPFGAPPERPPTQVIDPEG